MSFYMTLLSDVVPKNITVGCLELSLNLSLLVQLFKHPTIVL